MHAASLLASRSVCVLSLLVVCGSVAAQDVYWEPNVQTGNSFKWSTPQNWSTDALPGPGSNVIIDNRSSPELDVNTTIGGLVVKLGILDCVTTGAAGLNVTGTTTVQEPTSFGSSGIYAEPNTVLTLGTLTNFSNGVLHGSDDIEFFTNGQNGTTSVIQFRGAHVIENQAVLYLNGNGQFLDQDNGLNALRDLAINRRDIYIAFGGSLSVSGSFTNDGEGAVYMDGRGTEATFTVNGNFINATEDAGLFLRAPARVTIKGDVINYGSIGVQDNFLNEATRLEVTGNLINKSTGGMRLDGDATLAVDGQVLFESQTGMDMGGQPNVNTLYTTKLQIKNGIEFRGAFLTGIGTVFADVIFTQGGSVFRPGSSPGKVTVNGSLTFDAPTHLQIEIGGLNPGTQHDQIVQESTGTGGVTLNGLLDLSLVDNFHSSIMNTDSFTVLTSDAPLSGAFTNVASGGRVNTVDGAGSFRVTYSGNSVVVDQFQVAPPPTITSIPVSATQNSYIAVLGTGLLGTTSANVNGLSTFAYSVSETEAQVFVPLNATSGPVEVVTNHGSATSSSSLTILADSDGDGMSDDFETQYFGGPTAGDPNDDSDDGDGMTNYEEFLAGTDPRDANSRLRVTEIRRQGNDIVIVFPSGEGKRYRIDARPSPDSDSPVTVATLLGGPANPARQAVDAGALTQARRFYGLMVLP